MSFLVDLFAMQQSIVIWIAALASLSCNDGGRKLANLQQIYMEYG
jgi:hypothetical protein